MEIPASDNFDGPSSRSKSGYETQVLRKLILIQNYNYSLRKAKSRAAENGELKKRIKHGKSNLPD
jgi:hypothetical protein